MNKDYLAEIYMTFQELKEEYDKQYLDIGNDMAYRYMQGKAPSEEQNNEYMQIIGKRQALFEAQALFEKKRIESMDEIYGGKKNEHKNIQ